MRRLRGFTLLELVVVVVIVAITVAMIAPQLSSGGRWRELQREADTLAVRIRVAQDAAMLESREYGIAFSHDGYRFVVWDENTSGFLAVADPSARWALKQFADGISVAADSNAADPILVVPVAEETKTAVAGSGAGDAGYLPSVFVLSSGEVTPFVAVFRAEGEEATVTLSIDPLGNPVPEDGHASF